MHPLLELLAKIFAFITAGAGIGAMFWGAARRQRGREAIDEALAVKITSLEARMTAHASTCDEDHRVRRKASSSAENRLVRVETQLEALASRISRLES